MSIETALDGGPLPPYDAGIVKEGFVTETAPPPSEAGPTTEIRTFLIADVRGYTSFTLEHGDEAGARLASRFAEVARETVRQGGGEVIELRGDEALAVFTSSRAALRAAAELQGRFAHEMAADPSLPLRVGIGLDAGEAIPVEGGFRGAALNLAARLCSLAGPGEILASDGVTHLARKVDGLDYVERGFSQIKGFADPVRVIEVRPAGAAATVPGERPDQAEPAQRLPIGGFLGSLPNGTLVARDSELQRAIDSVEVAAGGTGQLVALAGEPGAGKTRLAQEVTLAVRNRGFLVAAGRCYEGEQSVPYYPFREAITTLLGVSAPALRASVPQRWPDMQILLPGGSVSAPGAQGQEEQQRLFWAISDFVATVAAERPVALLLDDLHWADASSLKLLHHLTRQTRDDRVFILCTYRDVEVGRQHPLEATLRDLTREGLVQRVEVRRLDREGTGALVATTMGEQEVSDEFVELVHLRTEGNPFFVQQVLRMLVERGDVYREAGRWERKEIDEIEVPESIRSVVGQRLGRLSEETQAVLREAAVLGQVFRFDDLLAMGERDDDALEAALDEAMRSGLVREMGGDQYAFDHALTQQSLYGELSLRRKRRLHLAAGEAIERVPERKRTGRVSELAWHFLHADEPEKALRYSVQAGDEAAALFAHAEAEWQYRTSIELAEELDEGETLASTVEKLGMELGLIGRSEEALELLDRALTLRQGNPEAEARILAKIGLVHAAQGTAAQGIDRVQAFIDAHPELSTHAQADLHSVLSRLLFSGGRYAQLGPVTDRTIELAEAAGDIRILAQAYRIKGVALFQAGASIEDQRYANDRAIELAEATDNLEVLIAALNNRAICEEVDSRYRDALPYFERHRVVSQRLGNPGYIAFGLIRMAEDYFRLGEWDRSRDLAEEAVHLVRGADRSWSTPYPLNGLGILLLNSGEEEEGYRLVREALEMGRQNADLQLEMVAGIELADWEIAAGHEEEALARVEPIMGRLRQELASASFPILAEALVACGKTEEACKELETLRESGFAQDVGSSLYEWKARVGIVSAQLAVLDERWEDAEREFQETLTTIRQRELPFWEARVLSAYGRFHSSRGETERARGQLEEALAIYRRLGAKPWIQRLEGELASLS
jgi:class 3 adenylate cyclase/tetratricopeptide (TPR) repeat protein